MKKIVFKMFSFDALVFLLLSFVLFYNGCSCKTVVQNQVTEIPQEVLVKANAFIINKTGDDFFKKYITADFLQSKHIAPNYLMVYKFYMPEKPFVDSQIRFSVDSLGNVLKEYEIVGIPECDSNPYNCDFVVDEKIAIQIAIENGLLKGITDWKVDFIWDAKYNKYVWHILNTISESKGEAGYRGNGMELIIDSNTGEVLAKTDWKVN